MLSTRGSFSLPAMQASSPATVAKVESLDMAMQELPRLPLRTEHLFHAGCYCRKLTMPAETLMTNVMIVIPTVLVVSGHVLVYGEGGAVEYEGCHVLPCPAGRKNAFYSLKETVLTMIFATDKTTVEDAESEFTNEPERLGSRRDG